MAVEKIERVEKGNSDWTMLHTELANQVIDRTNREYEVRVSGPDFKFLVSEKNIVLLLPDQAENLITPNPFYCNLVKFPDVAGQPVFKIGVFPTSFLFPGFETNPDKTQKTVTINKMLASLKPLPGDLSWLPLKAVLPDKVWLEIPITGVLQPGAATIKSLGNGDDWGGGQIEYLYDGATPSTPNQTKARIPLADIVAGPGGVPVKRQYVRTHLRWDTAAAIGLDATGANPAYCDAGYAYPA